MVGLVYGLAAYAFWGIVPIYWKTLHAVPLLEMSAWRIIFSLPFLFVIVLYMKQLGVVWGILRRPRMVLILGLSGLLMLGNWLPFVFLINSGQVMEGSLGYFLIPLMNAALGMLVLREKLRIWQGVALAIGAAGVLNQTIAVGALPWLALVQGASFAVYGIIRKIIPVDARTGLTIEMILLFPLAAIFLAYLYMSGLGVGPSLDGFEMAMLIVAGPVTVLPLVWFAEAARRIRYITIGLLQYVAPSGQFLIAVLLYRESFTLSHAITFGCIWAALAIYSVDSIRAYRERSQA
ncbi:MAG: EamA family transporter RarD [Alphaproteobacteria bacterium]